MFYVGVFFGISILGYKLCTIRVPTVLLHQYNENIFMHGYYSELEQSFLDLNKYITQCIAAGYAVKLFI